MTPSQAVNSQEASSNLCHKNNNILRNGMQPAGVRPLTTFGWLKDSSSMAALQCTVCMTHRAGGTSPHTGNLNLRNAYRMLLLLS
jgi:hypothetical protein